MLALARPMATAAGAALVAAGLATGALAHDAGRRGAETRGERAFAALDLTDAQRQQIRDIRENHRGEMRAVMDRLRAAHLAQREAAAATPLDEGRVRSTSQALAEAHTEMTVLRARVHQEILSVLTPEQQEKAKTLRSERGSGRKGRFGDRGRVNRGARPEAPRP